MSMNDSEYHVIVLIYLNGDYYKISVKSLLFCPMQLGTAVAVLNKLATTRTVWFS